MELRDKDKILLFVKRVRIVNDVAVSLEFMDQIFISKHANLSELRARLMPSTNATLLERLGKRTELCEIITPVEVNHLDHGKDKMTLESLELQTGDLICVEECIVSQQQMEHQHLSSIRKLLEREVNTFEIEVYQSDEIQSLKIQVSLDMTYDELADCVAEVRSVRECCSLYHSLIEHSKIHTQILYET